MLDEDACAGPLRPGQIRLGHALTLAVDGAALFGVGHPARNLVVAPPHAVRAEAELLARGGVLTRHGLHAQGDLDLVGDRFDVVGLEVADLVLAAPAIERLGGRTAVEAAVHLGPAAGAPAFGVGDRGQAERHGHTAGAVL